MKTFTVTIDEQVVHKLVIEAKDVNKASKLARERIAEHPSKYVVSRTLLDELIKDGGDNE